MNNYKGTTIIYLNYLSDEEKDKMTKALSFLKNPKKGKKTFIKLTEKLYNKNNRLELGTDNGRIPSYSNAVNREKTQHFKIIIRFKDIKDITEETLKTLGENESDSWNWRYFYGLAVCNEDRKIYAISYNNQCSPNWNEDYWAQKFIKIEDVEFPLINKNSRIYAMDDKLHSTLSDKIISKKTLYSEKDGKITMVIKDQHGNTTEITNTTTDKLFRDFADNYTGYRDYRRQTASEWKIVDNTTRLKYEEWKKTAKDLKSDWDKFYGNGIVD